MLARSFLSALGKDCPCPSAKPKLVLVFADSQFRFHVLVNSLAFPGVMSANDDDRSHNDRNPRTGIVRVVANGQTRTTRQLHQGQRRLGLAVLVG